MQTQIKRLSRKQIEANELAEGVKQDVTNAARYILQQANTIETRKADRLKAQQLHEEVVSASPHRRGINQALAAEVAGQRNRGMGNSQSNARLPTEKEQSLVMELGRLSRLHEEGGGRLGVGERSLDRAELG